jgi:MscS family membrane protein
VDNFDGFVEDIGIRSTRLRTLEKRMVTIPNYKIVEASVVNISNESMRQVVLKLGLAYNTTPNKMNEALQILKDMPNRIKYVDANEVVAAFTDFNDHALVITFAYFIQKKGDVMETPSQVNSEILRSFNENGIKFGSPTQMIYVENNLQSQ